MATSASKQMRALAQGVATLFAAATLTDEERRPKGIEHTDLPWACPPLRTPLILDGALQDHLDAPIDVTAPDLMTFWRDTLRQMWYEPSRVLRRGTIANLGAAMPRVKQGQRALRFSAPLGAPSQIDVTAGITLSLEVAHTAAISMPVASITEDDNTYVVVTRDGHEFGVANGKPLLPSNWTYDASGMVAEMLLASRGDVSYICHYDQIASVRSILHTHPQRFPNCFEAMDQALQALRCLSLGGHCPELVTELQVKPLEVAEWREKEAAYFDAIDIIRSKMNDRSKLASLRDRLVPLVMTVGKFKREIFSSANFPFCMPNGRAEIIERNLLALYKNEVPTGLQRPL